MRRRRLDGVRAELTELRHRLEKWRRSGDRGRRIPEELWREAERFARRHGLHVVSRTLHLDYYSLKRRIGTTLPAKLPPSAPAFVEVAVGQLLPPQGCAVEIVRPDGARLSIRATSDIDLTSLTTAFLTASR